MIWQGNDIYLDYSNMMAEVIGADHGITSEEIGQIRDRVKGVQRWVQRERDEGNLPFLNLPYQGGIEEIKRVVEDLRGSAHELVVLGIGGSALGGRALIAALGHPFHNLLPSEARKGPRVFFLDNIDPDTIAGLLDVLDLSQTVVNVVSKSGSTIETLSQFLIFLEFLKQRWGPEWRRRVVVTTDPSKGPLRRLAEDEGLVSFSVPPGVGGRFSVLTPVGLFPAAFLGIKIEGLLEGAAIMDKYCCDEELEANPALLNATLQYLAHTKKGKGISVMMPYADGLREVADWFRQLWAESLGKKKDLRGRSVYVGPTPVKALGVTDQHSQLQLYLEGPYDKVITFLALGSFSRMMRIPAGGSWGEETAYLEGKSLNELIEAERRATEFVLTRNKRSNCTIYLRGLDAKVLGGLFYLLEVQTAFAGGLYGVNPFDQPAVEEGKRLTYGMMGRRGYEGEGEQIHRWIKERKVYRVPR
ncbi:MAG: glucose-6-phosphate isomerase [Deltaproteobacteria bacterium]|nr:MAG: glucose-6-phosphate isomerase [Deltaproteobacteria bacterium]